MKKPTIPPKYINVPAAVAFQKKLPPAVILTYLQIRGLAWDSKGVFEADWDDIFEILGKPRTTIYRHLARLASSGWLRFNSTHRRVLMVYFSGSGDTPESSHFATSLNEDVNLTESESIDHPPVNKLNTVPWMGQTSHNRDNGNGWHAAIDAELEDLLLRVGVYRDKFSDVAAAGWQGDQIRRLAETVLQDLGPGNGGGVFLYRLKNATPPETDEDRRYGYADDLKRAGLGAES